MFRHDTEYPLTSLGLMLGIGHGIFWFAIFMLVLGAVPNPHVFTSMTAGGALCAPAYYVWQKILPKREDIGVYSLFLTACIIATFAVWP